MISRAVGAHHQDRSLSCPARSAGPPVSIQFTGPTSKLTTEQASTRAGAPDAPLASAPAPKIHAIAALLVIQQPAPNSSGYFKQHSAGSPVQSDGPRQAQPREQHCRARPGPAVRSLVPGAPDHHCPQVRPHLLRQDLRSLQGRSPHASRSTESRPTGCKWRPKVQRATRPKKGLLACRAAEAQGDTRQQQPQELRGPQHDRAADQARTHSRSRLNTLARSGSSSPHLPASGTRARQEVDARPARAAPDLNTGLARSRSTRIFTREAPPACPRRSRL
ncbi:hypothetical protein NDU88_002941 [Pleurodeles waltl]|uniref:Uncharacterized protein n=1 Tax=Pleurodeles waltl TaxID=8319 RepID=A0AAV7RCY1_PLEWA|nr:hypothetical protein NDU88_002941 [Pleurodeles waltl]